VLIVDSSLFSISSDKLLKKSIPVSASILSILVTKDFKLELLPWLFRINAMAIFSLPLSLNTILKYEQGTEIVPFLIVPQMFFNIGPVTT
jgi:cellobiose-specific phosphotransferase system component IIC